MADKLIQQSNSVFEITDYTTASDWERFIANLEQVLTDWNLTKESARDDNTHELPIGSVTNGIWHEEREYIKKGPMTFEIKYIRLDPKATQSNDEDPSNNEHSDSAEFKDALDAAELEHISVANSKNSDEDDAITTIEYGEFELAKDLPECLCDMISTNNDFASRAHCLVRWYNLRRFVILTARGDTLVSDNAIRMILSSASIALANVDCHVPIFVQHHNPKNFFFQGISDHKSIRTNYEMIHLKSPISQYEYLSELISMFRNKAGCNLSDPLTATIRLNYCLSSFEFMSKPVEDEFRDAQQSDETMRELLEITSRNDKDARPRIMDLRKDATFDQVLNVIKQGHLKPHKILQFVHVAALWPPVSDKVIVDCRVDSDLNPPEAPIWTMRCVTSDNTNMKIVHDTQAIYDLFCDSIEFAYSNMDADTTFDDCDRQTLMDRCLRLSYELAKQPEVIVSTAQTDCLRKLVSVMFYRASLGNTDDGEEVVDEIAGHLRPQPSIQEVYRNFGIRNRPSVKEFIIRSNVSRPYQPRITPALPQWMFCSISPNDFRLCGAFSELCI